MKSLLHNPGSKKHIASWIIENMPDHHSYLDPYFGGVGMFFEKPPSKIETINELDGDVVNYFKVIQNPESRQELQEWLTYTPYSRQMYDKSFTKEPQTPIDQAGYFAVKSMQSHGFRLTEKCGWKKDVHGREAAYAVRNWNLDRLIVSARPAIVKVRDIHSAQDFIISERREAELQTKCQGISLEPLPESRKAQTELKSS